MSEVKVVYEVEIDMPNRPEGAPVQIAGLGTFENGQTYDVSEEEAAAYRSFHTRQIPRLGESDVILGSDVELGPTLSEAAENMYGVNVREVDKTVNVDDPDEAFVDDPNDNVSAPDADHGQNFVSNDGAEGSDQ